MLQATRSVTPRAGERRFDYGDPATWHSAFAGVEAIFLMLPPGLPKARDRFAALLREARSAGVRRASFLSVRNADRLSFLPHRALEQAVEQSGLAWTHLRPNDWMQNFATQPLYRDGIAGGELVAPNGRSRSSYIDVRDVGAVAARTLLGGHEGRALSLTGPAELTLHNVAEAFTRGLGHPVHNRQPSLPLFFAHALRQRTPPPLAAVMTSIGLIARLGYAAGIDDDVERVLGRPPMPFATFVRDYREVWGRKSSR